MATLRMDPDEAVMTARRDGGAAGPGPDRWPWLQLSTLFGLWVEVGETESRHTLHKPTQGLEELSQKKHAINSGAIK